MKSLLLVTIFFISSCTVIQIPIPKEVVLSFTQCYKPINIHADTMIRIDGYYAAFSSDDNEIVNSYMFYNDGSVVMNVHAPAFLDNIDALSCYPTTWGTYTLSNDTITTQMIRHHLNFSGCLESKFKILDKNSFRKISTSSLVEKSVRINDTLNSFFLRPFHFKHLKNKPDSSCWLKEKKWFWCNEEDWEKYMANGKNRNRF